MRDIKLKRIPRSKDASDEFCVWELIVNGVKVGTWYGGSEKKYLNKEKWAEEQVPKRLMVVNNAIKRLNKEIALYEKERDCLIKKDEE